MQSEKLCRVQNHEQRKIMRSAKLCAAQNYAQFKIMHCAELCNVKIMKIAKNMQSSKLYTLNNHTRCQIIQGGTFMQCETCMQGADSTLLKGAAAFK